MATILGLLCLTVTVLYFQEVLVIGGSWEKLRIMLHKARFVVLNSGAWGEIYCAWQWATERVLLCLTVQDVNPAILNPIAKFEAQHSQHCGVADKKKLRIMLHSRQQLEKRENGGTVERCKNLFYSWSLMMMIMMDSNLTKSAQKAPHGGPIPVTCPHRSKVVPLNSWGRVSY